MRSICSACGGVNVESSPYLLILSNIDSMKVSSHDVRLTALTLMCSTHSMSLALDAKVHQAQRADEIARIWAGTD